MKKLVMIGCMILLAGCASRTAYVPAENENAYGYSESRLTDNRYRVSFRGGSGTNSNAVRDMALLRAAELTLLQDYDWFRVVNQETEQDSVLQSRTVPGAGRGQQVFRDCGPLGCTTTVTPDYSGTQVMTVQESDSYTTHIEIAMGSGELVDPTVAYNALELRNNLRRRY